jgi:lipopolysaccharide/colanic/teichoic acid biosynthesis glycosyltransferase
VNRTRPVERALKRLLDVVGAVLGLVLLAPVFAAVAVWIRLDSPGPVLFRQRRIGRGGRPFVLLKFRTMWTGADQKWRAPGPDTDLRAYRFQESEDPRVTRAGRWLRRTSLDELPNLWNVLRGEMSLVGPRPEVPEIVALYDAEMRERLAVKPGMTGLAQVSGRGELTTGEAIAYDLEYCRNWSLCLDIRILLRTVGAVLSRRGAV